MGYDEFFRRVIGGVEDAPGSPGFGPYAYQRQLAEGEWPDLLDVPTGLGKTAAVTGAWLYRRLQRDGGTPRRLVWCLPMRVLVEQVREDVRRWIERSEPLFRSRALVPPTVHVLMGGETDNEWVRHPEHPAVLIGTQDMLLSRVLMRGYGASRYRWPVDFALLHNDALWVFDEIQLMGAGLPTSAQLEAFRRRADMPLASPSRTVWSSATLRPDWLGTVDFRPHLPGCRVLRLPDEDRQDPRVRKRFSAHKALGETRARLANGSKPDVKAFLDDLADEVLSAHGADAPTLVIVNRVARAQELYARLRSRLREARGTTSLLLVHARFRAAERAALNARLRALAPNDDVIVVATQAVEAGVDVTSRVLFTELAPWSSLVQRFGRCNRGGEYDEAVVRWIDIETAAEAQLALPYAAEALDSARDVLRALDSASPAGLPPVVEQHRAPHVLRRKDLLDLFNTEPDLSGFDVDISPYLRDDGSPNVQVFWRELDERSEDQPRPGRNELCTVSIGVARDHLRTLKRRPRVWNTLESRWVHQRELADIRPGQVLMLESEAGGYDVDLGFVAGLRASVEPAGPPVAAEVRPESMDDDPGAASGRFVELSEHLLEARGQAASLAEALPPADAEAELLEAAVWHDVGKAHPAFQTAILESAGDGGDPSRLWAKAPEFGGRLSYGIMVDGEKQRRRHFRHELASMLAWMQAGAGAALGANGAPTPGDTDLVAYLIAAHHGKVRLALRALPKETSPPDDRLYARGVWNGDELPEVVVNGLTVPPLALRLDLIQLGEGEMGPSWSQRTAALLERWGPFRLAWLETLVRLADWRASAVPAQQGAGA